MGELLSQKGYEVRVLDLISMEKSHCYNPFVYLQSDNDIQRLVTNLFKATTPKAVNPKIPFGTPRFHAAVGAGLLPSL